jgi:hypothetical protein
VYISSAQTNNQLQSQSTALGASAAPGAAPALRADALKKAVTLNRVYARTIGWKNYTGQIAARLGITAKNPDIWSFIQALVNWQTRNMVKKPDGILGPEWHDLLTRNR